MLLLAHLLCYLMLLLGRARFRLAFFLINQLGRVDFWMSVNPTTVWLELLLFEDLVIPFLTGRALERVFVVLGMLVRLGKDLVVRVRIGLVLQFKLGSDKRLK